MPFTDVRARRDGGQDERDAEVHEGAGDRTADAFATDDHRALLVGAAQLLDDVDRALASLDDGSYGTCEVCGAHLSDRDLEEDPLVTRCREHALPGVG